MAGPNFYRGQYEFQCLHGMGEPLYEEVVGRDKLDRPCRVYAPVGSHETLLAYLVRRLLENGANTSFVNRIADASVPIDELVADPGRDCAEDPARSARRTKGSRCRAISTATSALNSRGLDFSNEQRLAELADGLKASARKPRRAFPPGAAPGRQGRAGAQSRRPCATSSASARHARSDEVAAAIAAAAAAAPAWAATPPNERAAILRRAADKLEALGDELVGLIVREAGKSYANAVARSARGGRLPALLR